MRAEETGVRSRTAAAMTAGASPEKAIRPVAISYSTAPKLNRSLRRSSGSARACSGDMYASVPSATPGVVREFSGGTVCASANGSDAPAALPSSKASLARPKSRIFVWLRCVTKMLAGLMSRWTIPLACAASNASAI